MMGDVYALNPYVEEAALYSPRARLSDASTVSSSSEDLLFHAIQENDADKFQEALRTGVDFNFTNGDDQSFLIFAMYSEKKEAFSQLAKYRELLCLKDNMQQTPLMRSIFMGSSYYCEALLKAGAKSDEQDQFGKTALMMACEEGSIELLDLILRYQRVNLEAKDQDGTTALTYAAINDHQEVVEALINWGANIDAADDKHWTALFRVADLGKYEMFAFLLQKGANVGMRISGDWTLETMLRMRIESFNLNSWQNASHHLDIRMQAERKKFQDMLNLLKA